MKILQINSVYKKGSTGKIVFDIHTELMKNNIKSVVCYGRGEKIDEEDVYKTSNEYIAKFNNLFSRLSGIQYGGCFISTCKLIKRIKIEKPDIVHLHCLNGFFVNIYWLLSFLKKKKINTVLTLHAEFMHTGNCSHSFNCEKWKNGCGKCPRLKEATKSWLFDRTRSSWIRMKKSMNDFDSLVVVSVSPWLMKRAKQSPILRQHQHFTILNGVNTKEIFRPQDVTQLKEKHGLKDEKIILHVTANFNDPVKGGEYVIELAKKLKDDNVKIIIIGAVSPNKSFPSNIIWVGKIEKQNELAAYYTLADLCVLTSKRETFSMICIEALSCGTPVVGFKAGGPEEITMREYSEFVEFGKSSELLKSVKKWLVFKPNISADDLERIHEIYDSEIMSTKYREIYKKMIEDKI